MNNNIKKYLDSKENKNILTIDDNISSLDTSKKYIFIIINLKNKDIFREVLQKLIFLLENEAILLINNWYDNISDKDSIYQLFNKWREFLKSKKFINYPITNFNQKAFIIYNTDDYEYWSD